MNGTAQWDQMLAAIRDMAEILAKYRDELLNQGFEREEVIRLVIEYQKQIMGFDK
ncbi:hypothetical protein [Paenibacillus chibensis]|uniref:hypothetical protein n=1 Tax=Paenibacillus chibensis TaxID=59846 RepID=UPI0013E33298|nr:hypothetical protein [Paenibacillus chibensis]MEC0370872.1 hypothetical protein [Paenibacillus chibensis]